MAMALAPTTPTNSRGGTAEVKELQFKIELLKLKPPLWRRVLVPSNMCFNEFHKVILCLFGWKGDHLHKFGLPEVQDAWMNPNPLRRVRIERKPIGDYFKQANDRVDYEYDFGEDWVHHIVLEGIRPLKEGTKYPKCTAGRRVNLVEYPGEDDEADTTTKFKPSSVDFSRMVEIDDL